MLLREIFMQHTALNVSCLPNSKALCSATPKGKEYAEEAMCLMTSKTASFKACRRINTDLKLYRSRFGHLMYDTRIYAAGIADQHSKACSSREQSEIRIIRLRLLIHILSRGLSLRAEKTWGSWNYQLRPVNILPPNSLIFELCTKGNLLDVRKMFVQGLASPFDISQGSTLLHVSKTLQGTSIFSVCQTLTHCSSPPIHRTWNSVDISLTWESMPATRTPMDSK
jgi:hypothetical protein